MHRARRALRRIVRTDTLRLPTRQRGTCAMRWRPGTRRYVLGCVIIAAYPALTLFPYDWTRPTRTTNGAARDETGAIAFRAPGIAKSVERPRWIAAAIESNRFSLELRLRPGSQSQSGPARIFTISADPLHRNLTVGQDGRNLVIRLRTPASDLNGLPPIVVPGVMDTSRTVDVHVAVRPDTAVVRIDGALHAQVPIPTKPLE